MNWLSIVAVLNWSIAVVVSVVKSPTPWVVVSVVKSPTPCVVVSVVESLRVVVSVACCSIVLSVRLSSVLAKVVINVDFSEVQRQS